MLRAVGLMTRTTSISKPKVVGEEVGEGSGFKVDRLEKSLGFFGTGKCEGLNKYRY